MFEKILNSVIKITFHSSPMEKLLIVDKVFDLLTKGLDNNEVEADAIFPIVLYS